MVVVIVAVYFKVANSTRGSFVLVATRGGANGTAAVAVAARTAVAAVVNGVDRLIPKHRIAALANHVAGSLVGLPVVARLVRPVRLASGRVLLAGGVGQRVVG